MLLSIGAAVLVVVVGLAVARLMSRSRGRPPASGPTLLDVSRQALRMQVLADASHAFAAVGHDYQALLDSVVRTIARELADVSQVRLLSEDGERLELTAVYSAEPEIADAMRALDQDVMERTSQPGVHFSVLRSGQPTLAPSITPEMYHASSPPPLWPLLDRFPPRSAIVVPLQVQGQSIGVLSLTRFRTDRPPFGPDDVTLALDLASRAALAINTARLFAAGARELAERRQAEAMLRELQTRTAFALAAARIGVWELNPGTRRIEPSGVVTGPSGSDPDPLSLDRAAALRRVHPDDQPALDAAVAKALDTGDLDHEYRVHWPDGTTHLLRAIGRVDPRGTGDRPGLHGVLLDVTEQRSLEAQFRQAQKMEAIGQLAGGVAHDFNNVLTAIMGYARFLDEALTDPQQRSDLDEIVKAADRAALLTRQLLSFSRRQVLETTLVDVNEMVEGMMNMLHRLIGEHITVTTQLAPDLAPVRADRGQLEQILMNLAVNARDAMPAGGEIVIETVRLDVRDRDLPAGLGPTAGPHIRLRVCDTGTGMSEEVKSRIFEPFFTTKQRDLGTGLGLSTVYGIVVQSGGWVSVESEMGRGTTFDVFLPEGEAGPAGEIGHAAVPQALGGTEVVLLAEDDEGVRFLAHAMLVRAGYVVIGVSSPGEAEEAFDRRGGEIDLLLTDIIMPGGTGVELSRELTARRPGLRTLFISGYSGWSSVDTSQIAPSAMFLEKPFTAQQLLSRVRQALDQEVP